MERSIDIMYAVTALLVACLALTANGLPSGRIVGGTDAADGAYPYQVSMRSFGRHICGGSIVNSRYILTAAHCVQGSSEKFLNIHVGTNRLSENGVAYDVEKITAHSDYNSNTIENDIALIRLAKDIQFNEKVQPIPLGLEKFNKVDYPAILTGWGRLSLGGTVPDRLQQIVTKITSQEVCRASSWRIKDSHICTLTKAGEGACHGDSGGPLVADGEQVGIVSFGDPCARGTPDAFTRVSYFADWIKNILEQ